MQYISTLFNEIISFVVFNNYLIYMHGSFLKGIFSPFTDN